MTKRLKPALDLSIEAGELLLQDFVGRREQFRRGSGTALRCLGGLKETLLETSKYLSAKGQKDGNRAGLCHATLKYVLWGCSGLLLLLLLRIRDVWPVFTCYLLSAYFPLAENRMRLQRTKSKQREKV